ncbi:MAG: 3-oxoacyl-[acyl-carrier-protein] reductase [Paracoccaceae bacterium]|uniref:3-oxoacyl-[acyl-carrier-protein] reductase n=1 Tax=Candidatus Salinivivens marinus TaxID=3381703 RepID=UPI000B737563|nr:3-oxoacyl-[acyl-carrier-protein] reductase [Marinovum sp.]OUU10743.1 MAG: 3-oxoacyl-[acyl-carrier-protein] reductase [Rhodobacteraceae bacterium TMED38]PDH59604.1 MAG: 3-oxoacyl-[acyl-carrier-protein] reductase [Rhodobacteraceae bacterium MED-G08]|tara:strand:+ start:282 stop:1019 length:738 start_codon:yes stop_codon:yes gene_type:complete
MFNLNGKNALITGASGGIGRAIAETLHASGARLTISGTRMEPLEELANSLGDRVQIMGCDLSNGVEVENLYKGAQEKMGSVDILVNNAGITRDNLFLRMTDEDWASVLEVNLTSTMRLCRGVLRGMMKSRWGRIVNIGSVVGSTGNPGQGNYAASKAALVGMSKSLANEVASRGITVNCIAPGFVKTAMTEKLNEKQQEAIKLQIPAGRMGEVSDIAFAALYLASEEASYITGSTLHVNGGMAML